MSKSITKKQKTPVVASPNINISHQQSQSAAKKMTKISAKKGGEKVAKKQNMNKILAAIDGSVKSQEALDFALYLADKTGAEIELFTVIPRLSVPVMQSVSTVGPSVSPSWAIEYYDDQKKYSEGLLNKAYEKTRKDYPKIEVLKKIADGDPANEIIEEAKNDFDLVVMGSRGLGFIEELVLGSVSEQVVHGSPIPVLVTK